MARIWIDTVTGTWGGTEGLVTIDVSMFKGMTTDDLLEYLDGCSNSEIAETGLRHGERIGS